MHKKNRTNAIDTIHIFWQCLYSSFGFCSVSHPLDMMGKWGEIQQFELDSRILVIWVKWNRANKHTHDWEWRTHKKICGIEFRNSLQYCAMTFNSSPLSQWIKFFHSIFSSCKCLEFSSVFGLLPKWNCLVTFFPTQYVVCRFYEPLTSRHVCTNVG